MNGWLVLAAAAAIVAVVAVRARMDRQRPHWDAAMREAADEAKRRQDK